MALDPWSPWSAAARAWACAAARASRAVEAQSAQPERRAGARGASACERSDAPRGLAAGGCTACDRGDCAPGGHRRVPRATPVSRARVLTHRLVDEVVGGALELGAHLLEDFPEVISALKLPQRLLVVVLGHDAWRPPSRMIALTHFAPGCAKRCLAAVARLVGHVADRLGLAPARSLDRSPCRRVSASMRFTSSMLPLRSKNWRAITRAYQLGEPSWHARLLGGRGRHLAHAGGVALELLGRDSRRRSRQAREEVVGPRTAPPIASTSSPARQRSCGSSRAR